jgi:hypothetical protein
MSSIRVERCRELLRTAHSRNGPAAPVHVSVAVEAVLRRALLRKPDRSPERADDGFETSLFESATGLTLESDSALVRSGVLCHS